jgi:hypothetical protein
VKDRAWFSPGAAAAWFLAVVALLLGGLIGSLALADGLCEDVGSPGSDAFCNHGGLEAAGLVFGTSLVLGIVAPAVGLALRRKRLFWTGVGGPVLLAAVNFVLAWTYGRG